MATDPTEPARPESAGLYALFETVLPRLKREHWGHQIVDFFGKPKDTGCQDLAEEITAMLSDTSPLDLRTPLAITNNTGKGDTLIINGGDDNSGITITSVDNSSVHLGPTGLTFITNLGDTITIGGVTINEGGTQVFNNIQNLVSNITNSSIVINNVNHNAAVIAMFRLDGVLSKEDPDQTGHMLTCDGELEEATALDGEFIPGESVQNDLVLAWYEKCNDQWLPFATNHKFYTGSFIAWENEGAIEITVGDECVISATGFSQVTLKDGLVHTVTGI